MPMTPYFGIGQKTVPKTPFDDLKFKDQKVRLDSIFDSPPDPLRRVQTLVVWLYSYISFGLPRKTSRWPDTGSTVIAQAPSPVLFTVTGQLAMPVLSVPSFLYSQKFPLKPPMKTLSVTGL